MTIAEGNRENTTFTSHLGTFRCSRLPFHLRNAPVTFQRAFNIILSGVRGWMGLVYRDDTIAFLQDSESHLDHTDHIIALLGEAEVQLKMEKAFLLREGVQYLAHLIRASSLSVSQ